MNLVRDEVRVKRVSKSEGRAFERDIRQAHTRDSTRVLAKRAKQVGGELQIVADPPLIIPIEDIIVPGSEWEDPEPLIKKLLSTYRPSRWTRQIRKRPLRWACPLNGSFKN